MSGKIRFRRFCLLLSYCGKQYQGMQRNPGVRSIEECLLKALRDSGLIPEEHFVRPQLMFFQRAARTDKSVSAIRQIVSLKIKESIMNQLGEVNNHLPPDIRLMGAKRVTATFDAKNYCDARTYSYLMPTFALCPVDETTQESYRVSKEVLKLFNDTLQGYVGTHVFHNFTSGKAFKEDSASRVIRFIYCSEPFYPCKQKELEFVVVRVKGQSFMMHQIRKMIGLAIAVVRGFATEEHIKKSLEEPYMDVPKAPGLGLMLEEAHFDRYTVNTEAMGTMNLLSGRPRMMLSTNSRPEHIYPAVVEGELKEKSMLTWLQTLSLHSYGNISVNHKATTEVMLNSHNTLYAQDGIEEKEAVEGESHVKKRLKIDSDSTDQGPS